LNPALFAFENQTRSIFASRKGKLILKHGKRRTAIHFEWYLSYIDRSARFEISKVTRNP